jgi:hypothetical protein
MYRCPRGFNVLAECLGPGPGSFNDLNYRTAGRRQTKSPRITINNALASAQPAPGPAYDVFGMASTPSQLYLPGSVTALQQSVLGGGAGGQGRVGPQAPGASDAPNAGQAAQAQAAQARAAQLFPTGIAPFMNPYINNVIDPTLNRMQQGQMDTQARIAADAASSGMYGGSRGAVASAIGDSDYRTQLAQTAGTLLNQGWNVAGQQAGANVANRQQTNLTNAGLQNAVNLANAQIGPAWHSQTPRSSKPSPMPEPAWLASR